LALDWGELRIGLALSDETQLLASPLGTLVRPPR
jgi:RNase H-fold protein (predicted Holliday junction resolvase)